MMTEKYYTTAKKVGDYESVFAVFEQLFRELKELCKKKPDATLNGSKVKIINRVLVDVRNCLKDEAQYKYLDLLDDEMLPQYSDAVLILSQHEGALTAFRSRHFGYRHDIHDDGWYIQDDEDENAGDDE